MVIDMYFLFLWNLTVALFVHNIYRIKIFKKMTVTLFQLVIFFQDLHQDYILNAKKLFLKNKKPPDLLKNILFGQRGSKGKKN